MSLHCNRRTQLLLLTGLILLVLLVAFLAGRLIPDSAVAAWCTINSAPSDRASAWSSLASRMAQAGCRAGIFALGL